MDLQQAVLWLETGSHRTATMRLGTSTLSSTLECVFGFPFVAFGLAAMLIAVFEYRVRLHSPESTLLSKLRAAMVVLVILGVLLTCAMWRSWFSGFTG